MVSGSGITAIAILAIGVIVFFSSNGIDRAKAFGESLKPTKGTESQTPSIPSLQKNLATNQSAGVALENTRKAVINVGSVTSKRRNMPVITQRLEIQSEFLPEISKSGDLRAVNGTLIIGAPTTQLKRSLTGKGTAQTSTGSVAILSEAKRAEVRNRLLTKTQQEDVKKLEARRQRAIDRGINPNVKLSGAELVLRKAEQAEIAKSGLIDRFGGQVFANGKLFAKSNFDCGGISCAESDARRARNRAPTIGKNGQVIENLGAGGSAIIKRRTEARVQSALEFNRRVIEAKKAGLPIPRS